LFVYREYYAPDRLISDHRNNISTLSEGETYINNVADPSIFAPSMQKRGRRWSVAEEYADCIEQPKKTALFWSRGDNDELGTRNRINEMLKVDPDHINPFTGERGAPHVYFLVKSKDHPNGCAHILRELRSQRREKIGTDMGRPIFSDEREKSISDHSYDSFRYLVASRPPHAKALQAARNPQSFDAVSRRMIQSQRKLANRVLARRQLRRIGGR
jgi:hypothetical protein